MQKNQTRAPLRQFFLPRGVHSDNPILHAELRFQHRRLLRRSGNATPRAQHWTILLRLGQVAAFLLAIALGAFITDGDVGLLLFGYLPAVTLLPGTLVYHYRLMFQSLLLAGNSLTREKAANTWELLLLTNVDTGLIVFGKWWAIVRWMLPRYRVLFRLRVAILVWLYLIFLLLDIRPTLFPNFLFGLTGLLLGTAALFLFTVMNLFFTAAIGVLASAFNTRATFSLILAIFLRVTIVLATAALVLIIGEQVLWVLQASQWWVFQIGDYSVLSFVDNGTLISTSMALLTAFDPPISSIPRLFAVYLAGSALALSLYGLLAWSLLFLNRRVVAAQGASV